MVRVNNETGRLDDMKGRTEKEGSDPAKDTRADTASRRGKRESRRGGKHGDRQDERLMERILAPENLAQAWKRVRANKGGSGIDAMSLEELREHLLDGDFRRFAGSTGRGFVPRSGKGHTVRRLCAGYSSRNPMGRNARCGCRR